MLKNHKVGVVVLAYRVENQIAETIKNVPDYIDRIYVVDDGSPDRTARIVMSLDDGRAQLIQHRTNQGPGAALATGYRAALKDDMDVVVKVDGDNQMPLEYLESLVSPIIEGQADYTKGDRLSISRHRQGMPRLRLFGNFILTWLTRAASGYWHLSDPQNGFTAISGKTLQTIDINLYPYYGYLNDLLVRLNTYGVRVRDIPMAARYGQEKSSIKIGAYIPRVSLLLLTRFLWRLRRKVMNQRINKNESVNNTGERLVSQGTP